MRIFLVGGGSGGATSPLLAVAEAVFEKKPKTEFFLIGTRKGIETKLLAATRFPIQYLTIPAGKLRRYFSFSNLFEPFKLVAGFLKSFYLLRKHKPDIVFGAGSYVQVPVVWAAFLMNIPIIIHQQDRELLLSTKLCSPFARYITISFMQNRELPTFSGMFSKIPKSKLLLTGNPVRDELRGGTTAEARAIFGLSDRYPTILVLGGSQGSAKINAVVEMALPELANYVQIIHVTGGRLRKRHVQKHDNYHPVNFLGPELKHAYAVADLVVARGGMSTITELSYLRKAAILIPLPKSPQEQNVEILSFLKSGVGISEDNFTADLLVKLVRKILWNRDLQASLKKNIGQIMPHDASEKIAKLILKVCAPK